MFQYPVVVRLRELAVGETISEALAERLGLRGVKKQAIVDLQSTADPRWQLPITIDGARILTAMLNSSAASVMLDGLDEVGLDYRDTLIQELEKLGHHLRDCKIIVTCRSGAYSSNIEGFDLFELCPLRKDETRALADSTIVG